MRPVASVVFQPVGPYGEPTLKFNVAVRAEHAIETRE